MYTIRFQFNTPAFYAEVPTMGKSPSEGVGGATIDSSVDQLIAQAKAKLEEAKRLSSDEIVVGNSLHNSFLATKNGTVEGLLSQIDSKNAANKTKIDGLIQSALDDPEWKKNPEAYKELQKLAEKFKKENIAVQKDKTDKTAVIAADTKGKVGLEKAEAPKYAKGVVVRNPEATSGMDRDRLSTKIESEKDPNKKKFIERVNILCNFDDSWGVESKNEINILSANSQKQEIGELQTANLLMDKFGDKDKLQSLLSRFSGKDVKIEDLDNPERAKVIREDFKKNVIARANLLAQISRVITGNPDSSAGLISVLSGKEDAFIKNLQSQDPTLSKLTEAGKKDKAWFQMAVNFLMSLGVQVATGGLISVGVEHREIGDGHPFSYVLGDKVNFTAKVRALAGVVQGNWNDRERAIIKTTAESAKGIEGIIRAKDFSIDKNRKDIVALMPVTQKEQTEKLFSEIKNDMLTNDASKGALIDVLTRNIMIGLAEKEAGWGLKGVEASFDIVSLRAFLGLVGQNIHTKIRDGVFTGANLAETVTNGERKSFEAVGIKYEKTPEGKYSYILPSDMAHIEGLDTLGSVTKDEKGGLILLSDKPLQFYKTANYKTDGSIEDTWVVSLMPDKKITSQKKVTTTSSIDTTEVPEMFSPDVKEILAKYPGYREWRRIFPQTFSIIRENLLVNGDADKALTDARKKVKPTAEFGKFLASLDPKTPEQKSEILSALINENAGVARFRQFGADGKKENEGFGKVYSSTKSDKRVDAAFDENEARTFYGSSHALMMKDQTSAGEEYRTLYAEKVALRSSNRTTLVQSNDKTKPIETLSADTGFFTFQNFAEYNGKGTRFHALKSQPTSQVLAGTVKEMKSFPDSAKKELLAQSARDKRYDKRFDALLSSINVKLQDDKKIDKAGLLTILQGDTVNSVKLSEPLKFYRTESAVCANDMITIGKPKFQVEGEKDEITVTDVPDVPEDVIEGITAGLGEKKAGITELSGGVKIFGMGADSGNQDPTNPTNPTTPGATPANPTTPGATVSTNGIATVVPGATTGAAFGTP